jgi:NAD(P)H dehydrogenase (quinone)
MISLFTGVSLHHHRQTHDQEEIGEGFVKSLLRRYMDHGGRSGYIWLIVKTMYGGYFMKVLILYYSKGGNTRKLAEAIAEGAGQVDGVEVFMRHTREVDKDDFVAADGLIVGSPVYFGTMAAQLKKILDEFVGVRKKMENKVGAAFTTAGDASGGKETTMMSIIQALLIYGMIIVGDPLSATGHYGTACVGAPDDKTRANGRELGRRVAGLVKQLA